MGINTDEMEKRLRGEDDEAVREILRELQEEKKGHQFKPLKKFDIDNVHGLQTIDENMDEIQFSSSLHSSQSSEEMCAPPGKFLKKGGGKGQLHRAKTKRDPRPGKLRSPDLKALPALEKDKSDKSPETKKKA